MSATIKMKLQSNITLGGQWTNFLNKKVKLKWENLCCSISSYQYRCQYQDGGRFVQVGRAWKRMSSERTLVRAKWVIWPEMSSILAKVRENSRRLTSNCASRVGTTLIFRQEDFERRSDFVKSKKKMTGKSSRNRKIKPNRTSRFKRMRKWWKIDVD